MITPWQTEPVIAHSADFCRNGVILDREILYARADILFKYSRPFITFACRVPGRHIYAWRTPGVLDPIKCPNK
jgi:hypothetical protein